MVTESLVDKGMMNTSPRSISTPNSTIPITQSQQNTTIQSSTNSSGIITNCQSTSNSNLVSVHHQNKINYVLEEYCLPIEMSLSTTHNRCKFFNRNCMVLKSKILTKGDNISTLSKTVFGIVPGTLKKFNYTILDSRLIKCFNPACKGTTNKVPKEFHHVCFMHMMKIQPKTDDEMMFIQLESSTDKILTLVNKTVDMKYVLDLLNETNGTNSLMFPICGKRCYNTIIAHRNKIDPDGNSEYANLHNWESDGSLHCKSSIDVLIEWFTTEENSNAYFGGVDKEGKTNANRKEAYHHHIRDLIKKENGM